MRWITRPGWPGNLLAMVAGALITLALAPFDIWPLAIVALVVFYLGLRDLTPRQALWRGWSYGFGLFGGGTSWIYVSIHTYGEAPVWLAAFLMVLFCAAVA
ncbi:MAG: apolipoprotein N-acyltransferase, partial [Pseudomonas sp.]